MNLKRLSKDSERKKIILDFIKTQPLGVISTISSEGLPEAAVVGISETENLELIFGTFNKYQKYKNLKENPRVAVVIGWGDATIQFEGLARELRGDEKEEAKKIHIAKLPTSQKFAELPEQCYFKVSPTRIRYTDYSDKSVYGQVFVIDF